MFVCSTENYESLSLNKKKSLQRKKSITKNWDISQVSNKGIHKVKIIGLQAVKNDVVKTFSSMEGYLKQE